MNKQTKLGISTFCYPYAVGIAGFEPVKKMDVKALIDRAKELKVSVVQIGDNYPLHMLTEKELVVLGKYAQERSIELEVGTRGILPENLISYIHIAKLLQSHLLRVVIDSERDKPDFAEIVARIRKVLPMLKENHMILGIENHDRFPSHVFAELIETLDSEYVGIVLDTVNSFACEENTWQVLDTLASYTVNFHMKDFQITRISNSMGLLITGAIAGTGRLDFSRILEVLKKRAQSDFSTIIELWMQPEETIEETIKKEDYWVVQSVANIQQML